MPKAHRKTIKLDGCKLNMIISVRQIKDEMLRFLRNSDILTKDQRGVVTVNEEFNVTNVYSIEIDYPTVKNVRSVIVDGIELRYGFDYVYSTKNKLTIMFEEAQTGEIYVKYDMGKDKIWADFPRDDLAIENYPRVAVDIISMNSQPAGIGGDADISEVLFTVVAYSNDIREVEEIIDKVRIALKKNRKMFFMNDYLRVSGMGRLVEAGEHSQIVHRNIDIISSFKLESFYDES